MKKSGSAKRRQLLLQHDRSFLDQGFTSLAGVDEAGRGPLAGPVVASAVIVRDFSFLSAVDDSKMLSPRYRVTAYGEILSKCVVGIGVIESDVIDRVNILQASLLAMAEAVRKLGDLPDCILVDGRSLPEIRCRQFAITDGDKISFSIACASIVAKVTRDRMMEYYDELYPEYGFRSHKGYGTREHQEALERLGPCRIHRRSFEPVASWKPS